MPIEIKELHIKINVGERESNVITNVKIDENQMNTIVKKQIEQVMHIESRKKER